MRPGGHDLLYNLKFVASIFNLKINILLKVKEKNFFSEYLHFCPARGPPPIPTLEALIQGVEHIMPTTHLGVPRPAWQKWICQQNVVSNYKIIPHTSISKSSNINQKILDSTTDLQSTLSLSPSRSVPPGSRYFTPRTFVLVLSHPARALAHAPS